MMKKIFFLLIATVMVAAASCDKDNDAGLTVGKKDIGSGVNLKGQQIILADRNVGATEIGGEGSYFNLAQALTACPSGYHPMTVQEFKALYADSRYNTAQKFLTAFKMPIVGYKSSGIPISESSATRVLETGAYYAIDGNVLRFDTQKDTINFAPDPPVSILFNVRCVKGKVAGEKAGNGTFSIKNGAVTFKPLYAGVEIHSYTDATNTKAQAFAVVLSANKSADSYASEPQEYMILDFVYDTSTSSYRFTSGSYGNKVSSTHYLLTPSVAPTSTVKLDMKAKTISIVVDAKDSAGTPLVKGNWSGKYIDWQRKPI